MPEAGKEDATKRGEEATPVQDSMNGVAVRIGRRETKRRLTGLTLPTVLGTGGGGVTWNIEVSDQSLARSVLQYLEDRRVLYDPIEAELPLYCRKSVQEIRTHLASFIANSQSPELRNPPLCLRRSDAPAAGYAAA